MLKAPERSTGSEKSRVREEGMNLESNGGA